MRSILLVDDYTDLREGLAEVLAHAGFQVLAAPDATAALEIARTHSEPIDLLLSDISLPDMLGWDLAEKLTANHPRLHVLLMSGSPEQEAVGPTGSSRSRGFIQKPFLFPELISTINTVLATDLDQPHELDRDFNPKH